jgi:LytTr DNA-binding domain-containing protein
MNTVYPALSDDLRLLMCLAFDHRAPADEVAAFRACVSHCEFIVCGCELTGKFDVMFEAVFPDLETYKEKLETIKDPLARLVSHYEAHFISKRFIKVSQSDERALWVPVEEGRKRVDFSTIEKVTAEGDYVRIHTPGENWMVHMTLGEMRERLGDADFVVVHRSTILRCNFIERLLHRNRVWTARLNDGSTERIAKSQVVNVLARFQANSSTPRDDPPNLAHIGESPTISQRKAGARIVAR